MSLKFVLLSDLHIQNKNCNIFKNLENFINCIQYATSDAEQIYAIFAGDIAYSGQEEEYDLARNILFRMQEEIKNLKFLVIPGNHDCDFSGDVSIRNAILESHNPLTKEQLDFLAGVQINFLNFKKEIEKHTSENQNSFLWTTEINNGDETITVYEYNTALFSKKHEEYGELRFPEEYLIYPPKNSDGINIVVFHHPIEWMRIQDRNKVFSFFEKNFDLIISGHEHQFVGKKERNQLTCSSIIKISAGALSDEDDQSTFAIVEINSEKKVRTDYFKCENGLYIKKNHVDNVISHRKFLEIHEDFQTFLHSTNFLTYGHEEKSHSPSLFISPTLYLTTGKGKKKYPDKINFDNILLEKIDNKFIFIKGSTNFGKTTLLKQLFIERIKNQKLPIFIDGRKLNSQNIKDEKYLLKRCFSKCYNIDYSIFENENNKKRCILIDDLDFNLKRNEILHLLKNLFNVSSEIIVTVSDAFKEVSITSTQEDSFLFTEFSFFEIIEWNNEQRLNLYEKWVISNGNTISPDDIEQFKKETASFFKKGLMPAVPFFLISYFRLLTNKKNADISSVTTYAKFYETIINLSLINVVSHEDLSLAVDYISFLAFNILSSEDKILRKLNINEINKVYISKKNIIKAPVSIADLQSISIIKEDFDGYSFCQNYLYYFFAAYYINKEMKKDDFKKSILINLFDNIDKKECSNIIVFLSYFSDDGTIIDLIKNKANSIINIAQNSSLAYWNDIKFIDHLSSQTPEITLSNKKGIDYQKEEERLKDSSSKFNDEEGCEILPFKLAEIISALLKNHADLDAEPKKELCKTLYRLHLYVTQYFFSYIEAHFDDFLSFIKDCIIQDTKNKLNDLEMLEKCKNILFFISAGLYAYIVKHITDNAVTKNLLPTHDALAYDSLLSSKFLDIILFVNHMECDDNFPKELLQPLLKKIDSSDKTFFTLLQVLISRHLSIHFDKISYDTRASICKKMNISRRDQIKMMISNRKNNI